MTSVFRFHFSRRSLSAQPFLMTSRTDNSSSRRNLRRNARRSGQSIVMAIMVMFLLLFLGTIFVALLRRSVARTERHSAMLTAQELSEAGLAYANTQLSSGVEGADWRPTPEFAGNSTVKAGCTDVSPAATADVEKLKEDPDFHWIRPWDPNPDAGATFSFADTRAVPIGNNNGRPVYPSITVRERGGSGGFTRVNYGQGRFLIRVTYNPNNDAQVGPMAPDATASGKPSPLSRFLMIESIGREGVVDPADPTTYVQTALNRTLVAFKPIGLVDYLRFFTDRERSGGMFTLGANRFPLMDGTVASDADAQAAGVPGRFFGSDLLANAPSTATNHIHTPETFYGPIRSNAGLRILGLPKVVLNQYPDLTQPNVPVKQEDRGDKIEVVGQVERAANAGNGPNADSNLAVEGANINPGSRLWTGTNETPGSFDFLVTNTKRIEAPDISAVDPNQKVPRYRLLTRFSAPLRAGLSLNQSEVAAKNGLGAGIFVDNAGQRQATNGSFSLVDDWMQPANNLSRHWRGPIYDPPGVFIRLIPNPTTLFQGTWVDGTRVDEANGVTFQRGLLQVTRSDRHWRAPNMNQPDDRDGIDTDTFVQYFQYPLDPGETTENAKYPPSFGNGVLYAEGNIRIWGKLPADRNDACAPNGVAGRRLTVVSNGTIYVDSSLLKGDAVSGKPKRSGIALLAADYVTINPTAFFTLPSINPGDPQPRGLDSYFALSNPSDRYAMTLFNSFDPHSYLADNQSAYRDPTVLDLTRQWIQGNNVRQELYTQYASESGSQGGQLRMLGNPRGPNDRYHPWWDLTNVVTPPHARIVKPYPWSYDATPLLSDMSSLSTFSGRWSPSRDVPDFLEMDYFNGAPVWVAKAAVAPMDIRVEAAMYAMNGSFFIIPGAPFNTDALDTRAAYQQAEAAGRHRRHGGLALQNEKSSYPFAREPLDVKITILGAITENKPAPATAQEAWSRMWGWTPTKKPSGAMMAHGGDGLSMQFDSDLRAALRFDAYGRPLPLMPRLPASPDLVYSGEGR